MSSFKFFTENEQEKFTLSFDTVQEELKRVLDEFGVAIVKDVLDEESCSAFEEYFASDWINAVDHQHLVPEQERDINMLRDSGEIKNAPSCLVSALTGKKAFLSERGLPHGQFAWRARLHPHVQKVYSVLYNGTPVESLSTGLDNPFFAPLDAEIQEVNNEWLHVDQNTNTGLLWRCYQGVLYVWETDKESSTTVVWPKSHKEEIYGRIVRDEYAKERGRNQWGQLVLLGKLQSVDGAAVHQLAVEGARRVALPPGSLLLWDSRLVHQGWHSGGRLAMPVCWEPRERRDDDSFRRKLWLCAAGLPSSHSSTEGRLHGTCQFKKRPQVLEGNEQNISLKALSVPWCVRPGMEEDWEGLLDLLWAKGKRARDNVDRVGTDQEKIEKILRQEVLDCL